MQHANGTLQRAADGRSVLHFERQLSHPVEKVWRVITNPAEMKDWFPSRVEGEFRPGGKLKFVFENSAEIDGTVTEFDPPRVLAFTWGTDALRFELQSRPGGSQLFFDCTFTDDGVKAARDGAGWHVTLDLLDARLDGKPVSWTTTERWEQVHPSYVAALGGTVMTAAEAQRSGREQLERNRAS